jgi:hypothetical protein
MMPVVIWTALEGRAGLYDGGGRAGPENQLPGPEAVWQSAAVRAGAAG